MKKVYTTTAFKCCLVIAGLLFNLKALAQTVTVSGAITDAKGNAVPFASIYIRSTTRGTSANSEGKYTLQLAPGSYEILFKAIGYKQESRRVDAKTDQVVNVAMQAEAYQLQAVNIGGEDPAYGIIRKAIKKRPYYLKQVTGYSCEVYIKGLQKLLAAPKKFMGRDFQEAARQMGLDSNRTGIIYLSESQSKYTFEQPDNVHEEMISSKVSGSNRAFSFNRASDIKLDFYENIINWPEISARPFISPIANNAMLYYRYELMGTTVENGETINKIKVTPRRDYDAAFTGYIYILEDSWRIYGSDLYVTKKANLNFIDTLKFSQQFLPVSKDVWMPSSIRFDFTGGIFGFKFGGYFIAIYKNYDINPTVDHKLFNEVIRISKGVNKRDSAYWASERPIPLTKEETTDYKKKEVLAAKRESKPYLDSLDKRNNRFKFGQWLLGSGYNHRNRYDKEYIHFSSALSALNFNTVEGFVLDYDATYTKQIDSLNNKYLTLRGKVRYGFASEKVHGSVSGNIPMNMWNLGFNAGSDVLDINNQVPFGKSDNMEYSLFSRWNYEKFYDKQFAQVTFGGRVTGGWLASIGAEASNRQWLNNTSNYSFFYQDTRQYTSNNPFDPYHNTALFPNSKAFKLQLTTSYDFSNRYATYPNGRYYFRSKYPRVTVGYTKGIKGLFGSDVDYDLLSANITKSDMQLGVYGYTSFYAGAGKFLNTNSIFYTDYKQFNGNSLQQYTPAANKFLLLDPYKFSTADEYFEGHLEHDFSGFILNKLPLIRKLKLHEIADFNYLATPALKSYSELGLGAEWFGIRAMYGWSWDNAGHQTQGFRFGVNLGGR
ncbi:hypothetical protein BEL04_10705 [Mucilaginibacter sp. PPCGB 2223]|uniref:DUF5686 and carboxypeptidase regulatory-like domain-containing protein n=1 Tax=Mucilaginibacter sp. PPCGB 2223 TaxID=1886027 RepID=UPI000825B2EF|nr:DUF5686 and carboxypeptidase regulatory-like domain-containing protein [Mucilaginibacter sp. PPCGB 2223]OCX54686.1 hypothetical protein BEL04_10705 [Mucilaginibacter sp. PPCGB 2223]